jgi:hypothetical protein
MPHIPASLKALISNLIDYAGLYPPAALSLERVAERYETYRTSPERWILNRVVLPAARLNEARMDEHWRITLLVDHEPGALPEQVQTLETKLPHRLSLPTYCEAPLEKITDGFAKVRTGGLTPEAVPASETLADFLCRAAARRLPFKATAGLHHPVRSLRRLTYSDDSPEALMHGFLNVFIAAAFAWHGAGRETVLTIINEEETSAFEFQEHDLAFHDLRLSTAQVRAARHEFAHSFGSCSFEEPIADLRELGILP